MLVKLQLGARRHSSGTSTNSGGQGFSLGSSPSLEVATLLGGTRGGRGGSSGGTPVADSPDGGQSSLNTSSISVSQSAAAQPLQQQQVASQMKTTPICSFQESVSPQATLIYRELYVLPFQFYDKLRKVRSFWCAHLIGILVVLLDIWMVKSIIWSIYQIFFQFLINISKKCLAWSQFNFCQSGKKR